MLLKRVSLFFSLCLFWGGGGVPSMVRPTCICCPWTGEQKGALNPSKLSHMV